MGQNSHAIPTVQETQETGSIPGSGRPPGGGHGNPFWYSCLEKPVDREAWWTTVHGVAKNQTQLMQLSTHAHTECNFLKNME